VINRGRFGFGEITEYGEEGYKDVEIEELSKMQR